MCGRFTLKSPAELIREMFDLGSTPELPPRYNIAPSQPVATVRDVAGARQLREVRWGLVPGWADDPSIGNRMINARSETLASKPAFREAFRRRRCLVPADGFYEWQKLPGRRKQPFFVHRQDDRPFAFAGLWERWHPAGGDPPLESCTLITTTANDVVEPVHDRMPVILDPGTFATWLDPETAPRELSDLLVPYAGRLRADPVSTVVNDPAHDSPRCIERIAARPEPPTLFD